MLSLNLFGKSNYNKSGNEMIFITFLIQLYDNSFQAIKS